MLYLRVRGWIWEQYAEAEPKKLTGKFLTDFYNSFSFSLEQFLTLQGHPVAACSSEDVRPAQRDYDSARKHVTLVEVASSPYSKLALRGRQGFQLSFQLWRELSIVSATEIVLHFHLCLLKQKGYRLCKGWDAALHALYPEGKGCAGFANLSLSCQVQTVFAVAQAEWWESREHQKLPQALETSVQETETVVHYSQGNISNFLKDLPHNGINGIYSSPQHTL